MICNDTDQRTASMNIVLQLQNACVLYFGIYVSNIPERVLTTACQRIRKHYSNLTIEEIKHSFDRIKLERLVTITVPDLVNPVAKYAAAKEFKNRELLKAHEEEQEKLRAAQEIEKHAEESRKMYKDHLKRQVFFTGELDHFFASTLAQNDLKNKVDLEVKQSLWEGAKIEYAEMKQKESEDTRAGNVSHLSVAASGKTSQRIWALKMVNYCIQNKIKL
jgi:hypothetical protein